MKRTLALTIVLAFATSSGAYAAHHEHGGDMKFKDMDTNKDGYISKDEAQSNKLLSQQIRKLDKNKDQQLDMNEFNAFDRAGQSASDLSPEAPVGDDQSSY